MKFITDNSVAILAILVALVALAKAIVKTTPTTKDDAVLDKVEPFVNKVESLLQSK